LDVRHLRPLENATALLLRITAADLTRIPPKNIDVLFVAGFGPIVRDPAASRGFYGGALGLAFKEDSNGYLHTGGLEGVKHFALRSSCSR
jgi:hypothetical protein